MQAAAGTGPDPAAGIRLDQAKQAAARPASGPTPTQADRLDAAGIRQTRPSVDKDAAEEATARADAGGGTEAGIGAC